MAKTLLQQVDTKRASPAGAAGEPPRPHSARDAPRARVHSVAGPTCQKQLFKFWEPRLFISIHRAPPADLVLGCPSASSRRLGIFCYCSLASSSYDSWCACEARKEVSPVQIHSISGRFETPLLPLLICFYERFSPCGRNLCCASRVMSNSNIPQGYDVCFDSF
jgi:hypothetical protein